MMSNVFVIQQTVNNTLEIDCDTAINGTLTLDGYEINPSNASSGQVLQYNGSTFVSATLQESDINNLTTDLAALVPNTRNINTAANQLVGGGNLEADVTLGLATSGVTSGSYTAPNVTIDAYGRIIAASNNTLTSGTVTSVATTSRLTGGPITTTGTLDLATSGVIAGTYTSVAVDAYGRVTSGSNPSILNIAASAQEVFGPTTNNVPFTITSYTASSGNYLIGVYIRNLSDSVIASVQILYTDTGGSKTITLNNVITDSNSDYCNYAFINCADSTLITVQITGGFDHTDYLRASASIMKMS
jgi:hypothetical protein